MKLLEAAAEGCRWAKAAAEAGRIAAAEAAEAALALPPSPVSEEEEAEVAKCGHLCIARYHSMAEGGEHQSISQPRWGGCCDESLPLIGDTNSSWIIFLEAPKSN